MATVQCLLIYVAAIGLILLPSLPAGFLQVFGRFEAGNSSFSPLQESSFWTSDGGNYTFGFQAVNGGDNYLLSIWHTGDPNKTAIWWPRASHEVDYDPTVKVGAIFNFTSNGSLELHSPNGSLFWSTRTASNYAELRHTGNLILFDNKGSTEPWQSFQDLRDSLMLVGIPPVANKPYLLQSRKYQSSYVTGRFRLQTHADEKVELYGLDQRGEDFVYLNGQMNTIGNFWIRKDDRIYKNTTSNELKRLTLDYDGNLRIYQWDSSRSSWTQSWPILPNLCMVGSPCGPFGICQMIDADGKANCSCPYGYQARVAEDPSQGCESSISFNASCGPLPEGTSYTTTMVEVPNTDYDYYDITSQSGIDIEACKQMCLDMCAQCMASVYIKDDTICYVKGSSTPGYLMNGYVTTKNTLLIKVQTLNPQTESKKHHGLATAFGAAAAVLVVVVAGCSVWLLWRRRDEIANLMRRRGRSHVAGDAGLLRFYRYDELVAATRNFSEKLGEGGFATVFKGWVNVENRAMEERAGSNANDNHQLLTVAVKVLKLVGGKKVDDALSESYSQFKAEISTLGKIHHVNLVSLLGYSNGSSRRPVDRKERLLVYEYMEKGSLDKYLLTTQHGEPKLEWGMRYSIALGTAHGIAYLHHGCSPPILHCDIKPHNILLDAHFTAKVADFGFARRFQLHRVQSHITMSAVRGTRGYLAPEWLTSDELTLKVDVYSFGMVLLELVRGVRAADEFHMPLVEWAVQCISQGCVMEFSQHLDVKGGDTSIDDVPSLHQDHHNSQLEPQEYSNEKLQLLKVGMWCIQRKPSMRPPMCRVVQLIEGTMAMEDPPSPLDLPSPNLPHSSFSSRSRHYSYSSFSGR